MSGLSAQEVAARLGVKLDTVYAYVSRGVLSARREPGSRRSVFDAAEVETLARRGRPRRSSRPSALDIVVETDLTTIADHRIRYRGRDACAMAQTHPFEQVAHWLWTGLDEPPDIPWEAYQISLPELSYPRDRIRAAVVIGSAGEPLRSDLSTPAVTASAQALIASMVCAVPAAPDARAARLVLGNDQPPIRGSIAGRLWGRLTAGRSVPGLVATLNAALVLLADHELASSTVAARAAAALETHRHLPGFGHRLYPDGDPRARLLLGMIHAATPAMPGLRAADALIDAARRHSRTEPNVDFALGCLATVARMPATAGETIFTIARTVGWIAHALEEYAEPPLRFRARAIPRVDDNQR